MMVNGPLEIYATVIGAKLYDSIFSILVASGVAFLPLLSLFFQNITTPYETPFANGADVALRRTAIQFFLLIFAIMLFAAPTHKLNVTAITYKPACRADAEVSRLGDTGTTYDETFSKLEYQNVRIPLGLALVLNGTSGITNAAITTLPCKTDVQAIQNAIVTTQLTAALTKEVNRFANECYAAAKAKFSSHPPDKSRYQSILKNYGGQSDLSWIGSHVLRNLYYKRIYPSGTVTGFPYAQFPDPNQQYNSKKGMATPKWGYPNCEAWWSDPTYGLQQQIVNLVQKHQPNNPHIGARSISNRLSKWLASIKRYTHIGSQISSDDVMSYELLYDKGSASGFGRNFAGWMDDDLYSDQSTNDTWFLNALTTVGAQAGQGLSSAFSAINRTEVAQEIPILQAILMTLCLTFGPIILILGSYQFNVIFSYYFILSSIISMTFIEKLIHYLELSLHASQSYGLYSLSNNLVMYNVFSKLYFYGPLLYLMLMSICGVQLGGSVNQVFDNSVSGAGADLLKKSGLKFFK